MSNFRMWEVFGKAADGPFYRDQNEYILKRFIPTMKDIIRKYEIKWDRQTVVNFDEQFADTVWEAAKEFFIRVGIYHQNTHRVMEFTKAEVDEVLETLEPEYIVGAGHDQRRLGVRSVEDSLHRPFHLFSPDANFSTDIHKKACIAYLKEPLLDGFCAPLLEDFMGRKVISNAPSEVAAAMEHAMNLRDAQRLTGRPDVYTVSVGTAETDQAQIAAADPSWGVRPQHLDGRMVSILSEMTTNNQMFNKCLHYRSYGNVFGNLAGAIYGGYAGGPEGTLILQTAYNIEGACLYGSVWTLNFPFHLKWQSTTTRELLWLQSVLSQAISRNSKLSFFNNLFANAGPGTDQVYYEAAAHALAIEPSGGNPWGCATCRNKFTDRATPLESRFYHQTARASFKNRISREKANEICIKLLEKYEDKIPVDNYGKTIQEVFDMEKLLPRQEYLDQFKRMKEELANLGVEYCY